MVWKILVNKVPCSGRIASTCLLWYRVTFWKIREVAVGRHCLSARPPAKVEWQFFLSSILRLDHTRSIIPQILINLQAIGRCCARDVFKLANGRMWSPLARLIACSTFAFDLPFAHFHKLLQLACGCGPIRDFMTFPQFTCET